MMLHFLSLCSLLLALTPSCVWANQFVDDYGRVHILREEPRIFCSALTAVALLHLGMPQEWLVGTYGSLYNRASNHFTTGESEYHTMDAQPEDLAILRKKPSVSDPSCLDASLGNNCGGENSLDLVKALPGVSIIVDVSSIESEFIRNASLTLNVPVVHIDSSFDGALNCLPEDDQNYMGSLSDDCYKRSFLDIVNRLYALADWMTVDTRHDRELLCKATQRFQDAAEKAQSRGVRFLTASIQNGNYIGIDDLVLYVTNPLHFSTVRTLEELGLPILWPGLCKGELCTRFGQLPNAYEVVNKATYFKGCPNNEVSPDCAKETLYPVDFWLLEGFGYQQLEDDPSKFKAAWPDPAMLAGQYMVFPFDGFVFSHRSLAGWLDAFSARINKASRLHERTPCKSAHVTSLQHISYGSSPLSGGEYACWNPQYHNSEYATCPPKDPNEGLSSGAVSGIAVGAVITGAALMFVVMKFILGYHTGIDKTYTAENNKDLNSQSEVSTADAAQPN